MTKITTSYCSNASGAISVFCFMPFFNALIDAGFSILKRFIVNIPAGQYVILVVGHERLGSVRIFIDSSRTIRVSHSEKLDL